MAIQLPELAKIDYTALDFNTIINLVIEVLQNHPDYFVQMDDFQQSNAGRMTIELVSYVVDLLAERVDWVANELTLPTLTQKEQAMRLLKLINYRLELPATASVTVTASITQYVTPFAISARYGVPATGLNGNQLNFELLNKNEDGKYIYEGVGSTYQFNTGNQVTPILSHNDLVFYEGTSYREFFTMQGINNESVQLERTGIEEDSIRVWRITRNVQGQIVTRRELPIVTSFISPEAQDASANNLPPLTIENTEDNGVFLVFGEEPVVTTFNPGGKEEILVWYRVTSGQVGNVSRNAINYQTTLLVGGQNIQITFVNATAASGGSASETLENAKRYGPLRITTAEKTVNPQDFVVLLQEFGALMNSIAYGKSNEPAEIINDFGYYIPPFETWIYAIFNKAGWPSFPTYSYETSFQVGRPYVKYGPTDEERITFIIGEPNRLLPKLVNNALNNDYSNLSVYNLQRDITYIPGDDYVVDLEARTLNRVDGGAIDEEQTVVVRYFENSDIGDEITINFMTGDIQDIPETPAYPGFATTAWAINSDRIYLENDVSFNDFNYPTNDYYIDYTTNEIIRKSPLPFLDSQNTFGSSQIIQKGINNEVIIEFDGLSLTSYNTKHDFTLAALGGWTRVGSGLPINYTPGATYYFKVAIDGGESVEYVFTQSLTTSTPGTWTTRELVEEIYLNAQRVDNSDPFSGTNIILFADTFDDPPSNIITFASPTAGPTSQIHLDNGTTGGPSADLFGLAELTSFTVGFGEDIDIFDLALRSRATLNTLGICNGFQGQVLPANNEEKPEIYSKSDLANPSAFDLGVNNQIDLILQGTEFGNFDGTQTITFSTVTANGPYDLTRLQRRLDLELDMQTDIDAAGTGFGQQDVVKVFVLRTPDGFYRIGFRLIDTLSTTLDPWVAVSDAATNNARLLLQFSNNQTSENIDRNNLVSAKVSPESDMVTDFLLRLQMLGASGSEALIKVESNKALHTNTLNLIQMGNNQYRRGTSILSRELPAKYEVAEDAPLEYTITDSSPNENNEFNLNITSPPSGFSDGDYIITLTAGTYNLSELIDEINTALTTADYNGNPTDISSFIICEKAYGSNSLVFSMIDFDDTATEPPDVVINSDNDAAIGTRTLDKLGFPIGESMSEFATLQLHYAGNWISDENADASEEASIKNFLEDKQLICQDYIIKDPHFSSFDIKGSVYVAKGFDLQIVKNEVVNDIRANYSLDNREFAESVAVSQILRLIDNTEGVQYTVVDYFGKDYQLYEQYVNATKAAVVTGIDSADYILEHWDAKSAFKITVDGTAAGGVNLDGSYVVVIGDTWTNRDYDSLLDALQNGDGIINGLAHAIPLQMGGVETNLNQVIVASHSSGIIKLVSSNEGPAVSIKIEPPDNVNTYGYQTFSRQTTVLESEYAQSTLYSIVIQIDGGSPTVYDITSPSSGDWPLYILAGQLDDQLPVTATAGVDSSGKIRVTSLLGGNSSTIDITAGGAGISLLSLVGPTEAAVDGTAGYINAVTNNQVSGGSINLIAEGNSSLVATGKPDEPSINENERSFNYKTEIPAKYDETLYISDDYYTSTTEIIDTQSHGIILEFVELGRTS